MSTPPASDGWCTVTLVDGSTVDVVGDVRTITDELHRVATRREHTFAMFEAADGEQVAIRPEAVTHLRRRVTSG